MRNEFKNILVPIDDFKSSMNALNKAITIANVTNGRLALTHVISYNKSAGKSANSFKNVLTNHAKKFMSQAKKYAERENVDVDEKILYGNPSKELLKFMQKQKFDLVVVGKNNGLPSRLPLGSVSNNLLQNSKVPVLVVK